MAGPGFINFHVAHAWLYRVLEQVIREGKRYGRIDDGGGERVQVEFVSINPTGPLHVGHGRNAAIGDSLANVLAATGRSVEREYYVNDTGRQMELFAASVEARYLQRFGREAEVPEEGYGGRAVVELAERIAARQGDRFLELPSAERRRALGQEAAPPTTRTERCGSGPPRMATTRIAC